MPRLLIPVYCVLLLSTIVLSGCNNSQVKPAADANAAADVAHLQGRFKDGATWQYTGGVRAGRQHGIGEMVASSGWRYKGTWANGQRIQGKVVYPNGDTENGNFLNGKTTYTQAVNGLSFINTYRNGKVVKRESALDAQLSAANYEDVFAVIGKRAFLGMQFQKNKDGGYLEVISVKTNSPADFGGLKAGDRIVQYAGVPITENNQFLKAIKSTAYGTSSVIRVNRSGKILDLDVTPSIRPVGYVAGPGMIQMNSYQQLISIYLQQLADYDERISQLDLPPQYRALAARKKHERIVGMKSGQKCALKEELWVYQGDACRNGLAQGKGTAVHLTSDLKFVGQFDRGVRVKGLIIAKGVEMYDGPVKNGRPDGAGICFYEGEPEECKFYRGKRVDAVFKQRIALAKQRKFIEEQQAKQQAQIDSLRMDMNKAQAVAVQRAAASSNAGQNYLLEAAKRKAADKVMDAVFDKLF